MPAPPVAFEPAPPDTDAALADLLAAAMPGVNPAGASGFLQMVRADPAMDLVAAFDGDVPLALYVLRKVGVTTELLLMLVHPDADPALALEAAAVRDAGTRVGRRPLTVETSERALDWYKGLGFKPVGKRTRPDGTVSYRLGWHAPRPGGSSAPLGESASEPAAAGSEGQRAQAGVGNAGQGAG